VLPWKFYCFLLIWFSVLFHIHAVAKSQNNNYIFVLPLNYDIDSLLLNNTFTSKSAHSQHTSNKTIVEVSLCESGYSNNWMMNQKRLLVLPMSKYFKQLHCINVTTIAAHVSWKKTWIPAQQIFFSWNSNIPNGITTYLFYSAGWKEWAIAFTAKFWLFIYVANSTSLSAT
jgi:hypothetical protein